MMVDRVPLKEYTDRRLDDVQSQLDRRLQHREAEVALQIDALRRELSVAIQTQKESVTKAEVATERRLESMNQFRETLKDQAATFVRRDYVDAQIGDSRNQISVIRDQLTKSSGEEAAERRAQQTGYHNNTLRIAAIAAGIALVSIIVVATIHFIPASLILGISLLH